SRRAWAAQCQTGEPQRIYDLGFDEAEARVIEIRADLMAALREQIEKQGWTQSAAARWATNWIASGPTISTRTREERATQAKLKAMRRSRQLCSHAHRRQPSEKTPYRSVSAMAEQHIEPSTNKDDRPTAPIEVFYVVQTSTGIIGERHHRVCSPLYETRRQAQTELNHVRTRNSGEETYSIWSAAAYLEPARWRYEVVMADGTVIGPQHHRHMAAVSVG